ncbi:hypothetical protein ElyMa_002524000 [Elysia marginata]|uniref:Uncharacterized protein n=1 Tax=Elysia marginata TaxID=1093978 RepID=A0AAV4GTJ2_9GAST|nr:hypothetical protein ElyMa_002524000 [Elysia marginata]
MTAPFRVQFSGFRPTPPRFGVKLSVCRPFIAAIGPRHDGRTRFSHEKAGSVYQTSASIYRHLVYRHRKSGNNTHATERAIIRGAVLRSTQQIVQPTALNELVVAPLVPYDKAPPRTFHFSGP